MYYPIIRQCVQALKNLETWLDKAEQHAGAKKFDVGVLLSDRLAPDMHWPFGFICRRNRDGARSAPRRA